MPTITEKFLEDAKVQAWDKFNEVCLGVLFGKYCLVNS